MRYVRPPRWTGCVSLSRRRSSRSDEYQPDGRPLLATGPFTALNANELETPNEAPLGVLSAIDCARGAIKAIGTLEPSVIIPKVPTTPMALAPLRQCLHALQTAGRAALDAIIEHSRKSGNGRDAGTAATRYSHDKAYGSLRSVLDEAQEVEAFLSSSAVRADAARCVLAMGRAGTGKSHVLAAEVDRLTRSGAPAIMLLRSWFSDGLPLAGQIPGVLGLDTTWDALLDTMNAAAGAKFHRRRWNGTLLPSRSNARVSFWAEGHSHSG